MDDPLLRLLAPTDSFDELTDLLHRAYKPLADAGMRYLATWQDAAKTRERCLAGECWIGESGGRIVATATLSLPGTAKGTPWFERADVAAFHQFAVEPKLQGSGLGGRVMSLLEERAAALGAKELALDTAEGAAGLIAFYAKRGYRFVEHADWRPDANYLSVVLSKTLRAPIKPS